MSYSTIVLDESTAVLIYTLARVSTEALRSNIERNSYSSDALEGMVNLIRCAEKLCTELKSDYPDIECPFTFRST